MRTKKADVPYCGVRKEVVDSAEPILNWENVYHFKKFVVDRYRIHKRKDLKGLPAPWTDNPVLREFKFTNVRREHDRQTRYLIKNIIKNDELTLEDKIINCFMFRCWNNWSTLDSFGFPYSAETLYSSDLKEFVRPIYKRLQAADPGRLWWSNAYNQGGTKYAWKFPDGDGFGRAKSEAEGSRYTDYEPDIPLRPFHVGVWLGKNDIVNKLLNAHDQKECFEIIKSIKGFADFLAYQVFVDLTYIPEFPFSENEFTVAGPGCKRGLDLIFKDKDGMTYEECIFWLRDHINAKDHECLFDASELTEYNYGHPIYAPVQLFHDLPKCDRIMNVMSIENCMCELSKYVKAVNGTGRPRNKYKGGI